MSRTMPKPEQDLQSKREEIREGFDKLVRENAKSETLWYYLHINGVVIKVEREHNVHDNSGCACDTCSIVRAVRAGYVPVVSLVEPAVKPLIEEE